MDLFSDIEKNPRKSDLRETDSNIVSVSAYLDSINRTLKSERARIVGEVSGLQEYPGRNYLFFSVKDKADQATIKCFMWKSDLRVSGVTLSDGLEIIVNAYPSIYKPNGTISLQVEHVELVGEGALKIAYDKLKAKLSDEGLFAQSRKREIPEFPQTIGVITSKSGAVIHDFNTNLGKCGFEILFVDSKVEGADAVKDLLAAVRTLSKKHIDVLVMMRGGGSLESFQAFNNETLVRAVAEFPAPVITGIGHDQDAPLVSFVSDKNVSTPTAVANLLSLGFAQGRARLQMDEQNLLNSFEHSMRDTLFFLEQSDRIMERFFQKIFEKFAYYFQAIHRAAGLIQSAIIQKKSDLENFARILEARNPENQLRLGWSLVRKGGKIVRSVRDIATGEEFEISVVDGTINAQKI